MGRYPVRGQRDRIIPGHVLLHKLLGWNFVLAASGLVRRECYDKLGAFPLDMPWAGDWYLWCLFALHYDVAYFAEPMVCYRTHELSMTNTLFKEDVATCCEEDVRVPWTIKQEADEAGFLAVSRDCLDAVAQIEESLCRHASNQSERERVRARVYAGVGNEYYWQAETALAKEFYGKALEKDPWMPAARIKRLLLSFGKSGDCVRKRILSSP